MAVIRDTNDSITVNYFATAALFCGVAATIVMLKFRGFRSILNIASNKNDSKDAAMLTSSSGVYRLYKDDYFDTDNTHNPPARVPPPRTRSKRSTNAATPTLQSSKSASELRQPKSISTNNLSKSTVDISQNPKGASEPVRVPRRKKNQENDTKIEKQRLVDQKKIEKKEKAAALKEAKEKAARDAKLKKEQEKAEKERLKQNKKKPKAPTPPGVNIPPPPPLPNSTVAQQNPSPENVVTPRVRSANPLGQTQPVLGYARNTLDSSISKTSGPPPYSEQDKRNTVPNQSDNSGNTSFLKPPDNQDSSWDFISQHRQQIHRPVNRNPVQIQKGADLQYDVGKPSGLANNSEA